MTTEPSRVVIVGASAAGLTTATALRRNGYDRDITLVDAETRAPYDRPPLSKHLLSGEWSEERLALKTDAELADLAVGIRSGVRATTLDVAAQRLALSDGSELDFDRLVLATGVRPRMLPGSDALRGVHTLRTLEDALSLRADLRPGMRLVVVGGGFLGTEVAATAVGLGADVTLVSAAPTPLERSLGPAIGVQVASLHRARGVVLRTGPSAAVVSLVSSGGSVTGVELADDTRLDADAVFVAIGAEPDLRWLAGSGIPIGDGIECAPDLSVAPGIYAAGDVAHWENPVFGEAMRVEHRTNATEQGMHVAKRIVAGDAVPFASVPYFWTDQYELKLQVHGWLRGYDEVRVVEGSFDEGRMVALFRRGERLVGVMGIGAAKVVRGWRQHVLDGAAWASVVDA